MQEHDEPLHVLRLAAHVQTVQQHLVALRVLAQHPLHLLLAQQPVVDDILHDARVVCLHRLAAALQQVVQLDRHAHAPHERRLVLLLAEDRVAVFQHHRVTRAAPVEHRVLHARQHRLLLQLQQHARDGLHGVVLGVERVRADRRARVLPDELVVQLRVRDADVRGGGVAHEQVQDLGVLLDDLEEGRRVRLRDDAQLEEGVDVQLAAVQLLQHRRDVQRGNQPP